MKNERFDITIMMIIIFIGIASSNYGSFSLDLPDYSSFACLPALSASAYPAPFMSMLSTDVFLFFYIPSFLFVHPLDYY